MSAESEFYSALTGAAGVTTIVGVQIYPDIAPEGNLPPMVVYERRGSVPVTTIHDDLKAASKVSLSATCWSLSRISAEHLGDEVEIAMRQTGISVNRFGHYDAQKRAYASVIDFEVWELP